MNTLVSYLADRPVRAVAAAMLVAAAAVAFQPVQAMPFNGPGGHHGGPGMGMAGPMTDRMLDGVNATAEQRTRIHDIMKAARDDLRKQHDAQQGLRDQMMQAFAQPTVDARAVESLRQQMLAAHDQASKRMTQAMLDASAVLSADQRKQLAERMKQRRAMMERHRAERDSMERPSR